MFEGPQIIAALALNHVIGRSNALPWKLSNDLANFRRLTKNGTLIMGRRTFESLPGLLPGRRHIVVSSKMTSSNGVEVVSSFSQAIEIAGKSPWIIGGASIFEEALPVASRLCLSVVFATPDGDTLFPTFDAKNWRVKETAFQPADEKNEFSFKYLDLVRAEDFPELSILETPFPESLAHTATGAEMVG